MHLIHCFSPAFRICMTALLILFWLPAPLHAGEGKGAAFYDFGVFALEDNDFEGAEQHFKKAVAADPQNPLYQYYLGKTYLKTKRYEEAKKLFNLVIQQNGDLDGLKYDLALTHFHLEEWPQATFLFSIVAAEKPDNVLALYHLGLCNFKRERYKNALEYFQRAGEKNAGIKPNCALYAGLCHLKSGELQQAEKEFDFAAGHAGSKELEDMARKWKKAVQERIKADKPYRLYCRLGGQYDSNVPLEPVDQDLYSKEEDWALAGFLSGRYRLLQKSNMDFGLGYNHYQNFYKDFSQFNTIASTPNVFASYKIAPMTFSLNYLPTYYWIDGERYLRRHQVRPEIAWKMSPQLDSLLSFNYYHNRYLTNPGRSGHSLGGEAEIRYRFSATGAAIFCGLSYEDNFAEHGDYAYRQAGARLGGGLPLPFETALSVTGRVIFKQYKNMDSVYAKKRKDGKYSIDIILSRNLYSDWLAAECSYTYSKNSANIENYEYQSNVAALAAVIKF